MTMKPYAVLFACLLVSGPICADEDPVQVGIFETYLKLAEEGDMNAQYIIAHRYEIGKGTAVDLQKANYWYDRAAAKGHPLALRKVEERRAAEAPAEPPAAKAEPEKPKVVAAVHTPAPKKAEPATKAKPAPTQARAAPHAAPQPVAKVAVRAPEAKQPASTQEKSNAHPAAAAGADAKARDIVAKAAVEPPAPTPSINALSNVLGGNWNRNRQPAEFMPSSHAACLQSGGAEVVCFSQELTRNVAGAALTFNVKATLSGFDNRDGRFTLSYMYNVVHVAGKPDAEALTDNSMSDLVAKTGWQQPGQTLECRMSDERFVSCARADRKLSYQFVRD